MIALRELAATLWDAWLAADMPGRLRAWWWVVRNPALLGPEPVVETQTATDPGRVRQVAL